MTRILIVDLETAPKQAYVWRFFKENVGVKQVLSHGYMMSFAYKWLGDKDVQFHYSLDEDDSALCVELADVLNRADIVVAHNAEKFDLPTARGRMLVHGLRPPSPFKVVDTLRVAKREFLFPSNSLAYLAEVLDCGAKDDHKEFPGFDLWAECIKGNPRAWEEMKKYNIQDVETLEEIYLKMRPYMRTHPNVGVFEEEDRPVCPKCGSHHIQLRGYTVTNVGKYRKFQCQECGGWARSRFTEYPKDKRKQLVVNAV